MSLNKLFKAANVLGDVPPPPCVQNSTAKGSLLKFQGSFSDGGVM
jgi:hypothetical protein